MGNYGSKGPLAVPSKTRPRHCDEQTKGLSGVRTPCPCRLVVLSEGWHRVFLGDSCL
jgi:hypothetical protein